MTTKQLLALTVLAGVQAIQNDEWTEPQPKREYHPPTHKKGKSEKRRKKKKRRRT